MGETAEQPYLTLDEDRRRHILEHACAYLNFNEDSLPARDLILFLVQIEEWVGTGKVPDLPADPKSKLRVIENGNVK